MKREWTHPTAVPLSDCGGPKGCPLKARPDVAELAPSVLLASITTSYAVHAESAGGHVTWQSLAGGRGYFDVLLRPSPGVILASCLLLGCSVSSYVYRHHPRDAYQPAVFVLFIVLAVLFGIGVGSSANLLLLGFVPWGSCAAMLVSGCGHALARYLRGETRAHETRAHEAVSDKAALLA